MNGIPPTVCPIFVRTLLTILRLRRSAIRAHTGRPDDVETVVSSHDAIVELVGISNIHHAANNFGLVTLHV